MADIRDASIVTSDRLQKIAMSKVSLFHLPIALVSSRLAFNMENLNLARTSDLLHETSRRYKER